MAYPAFQAALDVKEVTGRRQGPDITDQGLDPQRTFRNTVKPQAESDLPKPSEAGSGWIPELACHPASTRPPPPTASTTANVLKQRI